LFTVCFQLLTETFPPSDVFFRITVMTLDAITEEVSIYLFKAHGYAAA